MRQTTRQLFGMDPIDPSIPASLRAKIGRHVDAMVAVQKDVITAATALAAVNAEAEGLYAAAIADLGSQAVAEAFVPPARFKGDVNDVSVAAFRRFWAEFHEPPERPVDLPSARPLPFLEAR